MLFYHRLRIFLSENVASVPLSNFRVGVFHWWFKIFMRMWTNWILHGDWTRSSSSCFKCIAQSSNFSRVMNLLSSMSAPIFFSCLYIEAFHSVDSTRIAPDILFSIDIFRLGTFSLGLQKCNLARCCFRLRPISTFVSFLKCVDACTFIILRPVIINQQQMIITACCTDEAWSWIKQLRSWNPYTLPAVDRSGCEYESVSRYATGSLSYSPILLKLMFVLCSNMNSTAYMWLALFCVFLHCVYLLVSVKLLNKAPLHLSESITWWVPIWYCLWIWYQLNFIEWAWSKIRRSAFIYCDWLGLFISRAGVSHVMSSDAECIKELQVLDIFLAHWTLQVTDYKVLKEKLIFFVQMVQLSVPLLDVVLC